MGVFMGMFEFPISESSFKIFDEDKSSSEIALGKLNMSNQARIQRLEMQVHELASLLQALSSVVKDALDSPKSAPVAKTRATHNAPKE